jgi:hypothetical protein
MNCLERFDSSSSDDGLASSIRTVSKSSYVDALQIDIYFGLPNNALRVYTANGNGIAVLVHNSSTLPLSVNPLFLQGNAQANIEVSRSFLNHYPQPYSQCSLADGDTSFHSDLYDAIVQTGFEYTQSDCINQCIQKNLIDLCGCCYLTNIPCLLGQSYCNSTQAIDCFTPATNSLNVSSDKSFIVENCLPRCPLECKTNGLSKLIS